MGDIDTMRRWPLPDLLSPHSDVRPLGKDATNSLTQLGTMFVATMEDARDFIEQLEATFCNELWPAFSAEIANSRCRIVELEKYVDESKKRERMELEERQEREADRARLLGENDVLKTKLDQERSRFDKCLELARQSDLHPAEGAEKKGTNGDNLELQRLMEENQNQQKQRQILTEELERLHEVAKLSEARTSFLKAENERLSKNRADYEKSQALQTRQSTLKNPAEEKGPSLLMAGKGVETVLVVSCDDHKYQEQSLSNLQRQPNLVEGHNHHVNQGFDSTVFNRETKKQMRGRSPPLDGKAENIVDGAAVSIAEECPPIEPNSQGGLVKEPENADDLLDIVCSQRPNAGHTTLVDSDETVLDVVQPESSTPGAAQEPTVIRISGENQVVPADEPVQRASSRSVMNAVMPKGPLHRKSEDVERTGAPPASNPLRPRMGFGSTSNAVANQQFVNRSKDHSWRKTRSRAEPYDGDPHDSFLDTPHERAVANLNAAATREQKGATEPHALLPPVGPAPAKSEDQMGDGMVAIGEENAGGRRNYPSASNSGDHDRTEKGALRSKAPRANQFKFNEPVRKKRDREALKATDCPICKKFYDAVEAEDAAGILLPRCEHHDAVSRHRYQYLPPPTPPGFWNLGFGDSHS